MAKKFYTIMIVPHAKAQLRKIHLSKNFLIYVSVVLGLLLISSVFVPHLFFKMKHQSGEMSLLHEENEILKNQNKEFEQSISALRQQLTDYEQKSVKFAAILGISEEIPTSSIGVGGGNISNLNSNPSNADIFKEEMDTLKQRSEKLDSSFKLIEERYSSLTKKLNCVPSIMPVSGIIGYNYGWRKDPFTGKRDFHRGLDIAAPRGTVIKAPADGVVTKVRRLQGYGKSITISHGNGIRTFYCHLHNYNVKVGHRVKRGDVIGYVGSTGRSTGPHLHYEVYVAGKHVNPLKYILDIN